MVDRVTIKEEFVMFPFEFITPTEIVIEEVSTGVAIIRGTLIREGVSRNKNLYTFEELESVAEQAEGMPLYVGTMTKMDPNLGIRRKNMHANIEENRVGRIISTTIDRARRLIKFLAELVNTENHPHIIEEVKKGWGVSIGGIAQKVKIVMDEGGRIMRKILGLVLNHVQLLPPYKKAGMVGAEVENVEIQESMIIGEIIEIVTKPHYKLNLGDSIGKVIIRD